MAAAAMEPLHEAPDDVVDEIMLRLPSPASLARAAAACSSFRAIVSSPQFLRRHRALHPDPGTFLGAFSSAAASGYDGAFHPADPPHPAAAAARAVAGAADFSFAFLPKQPDAEAGAGTCAPGWIVRDQRDGRFLHDRTSSSGSTLFTDLTVCDPMSRRYVLLPPIPEELAAAVKFPLTVLGGRRRCEPFLSPAVVPDDAEEEEDPSFVVIWTARCTRKVVAFAYTSRDRRWRALPSPDCFVWRSYRSPFAGPVDAVWNRRHYAHGRFYWVDCLTNRWLVLNTATMELSVEEIPSPTGFWEEHVAVVEGADGKVGVFAHDFYHADGNVSLYYYTVGVFAHDFYHADGNVSLYYYTILRDGDGAPRWQLERTVPLPWPTAHGRPHCIRGSANGCLIIEVNQDSWRPFLSSHRIRDVELFSIDVKSFQVERICQTRITGSAADGCWPYFGFPPLLTLPTV